MDRDEGNNDIKINLSYGAGEKVWVFPGKVVERIEGATQYPGVYNMARVLLYNRYLMILVPNI